MSQNDSPNFYSLMLGLPDELTEPDHYQILDLPHFTENADAIRAAAATQNGKLLKWQNSEHFRASMDLVREVVEAKRVLGDPELKREYDEQLKQRLEPSHRKANTALLLGWILVALVGGSLVWYAVSYDKTAIVSAPEPVAESTPMKAEPSEPNFADRETSTANKSIDEAARNPNATTGRPQDLPAGERNVDDKLPATNTTQASTPTNGFAPAVAEIDADALSRRAKELADAEEVRDALAIYERIASMQEENEPIDYRNLRHLYARTMQWDKALDAFLQSAPRTDPYRALLMYETQQYEKYRTERRFLLTKRDLTSGIHWNVYARMAILLPVEPELHEALRTLLSANTGPEADAGYRKTLVGRLKHRLGEFSEWAAGRPEDVSFPNDYELLVVLDRYQRNPSEENLSALEEQLAKEDAGIRRETQDGVVRVYWSGYVQKVSLMREAKILLAEREARPLSEPENIRRALSLHEQAAALPGPGLNDAGIRDLYARTLQWDKAAQAAEQTLGPLDPFTVMAWHKASRLDKYRAGRKALLEDYRSLNQYECFRYAQLAALHSAEPELRPALEYLARVNAEFDGPGSWQNRRMVGPLKYRLGEFADWHNGLPEKSNLHTVETRVIEPTTNYRDTPSDENRLTLTRQIAEREKEIQGFYFKEEILKPRKSLDNLCWFIHASTLLEEAKRVLNDTEAFEP